MTFALSCAACGLAVPSILNPDAEPFYLIPPPDWPWYVALIGWTDSKGKFFLTWWTRNS